MLGLDKLTDIIKNAFEGVKTPAPTLPSFLLWCTAIKRPGMSVNKTVAKIIAKNSECGIPTEKNPDGSENLYNQLCYNITESIINTIKEDAVVNLAMQTGAIQVSVDGANAGGPFTAVGFNVNQPTGSGIIQ